MLRPWRSVISKPQNDACGPPVTEDEGHDSADRRPVRPACGVLVAAAAGDALGAPYEFGPPLATDFPVSMTGGGTLARQPGEWTDDTSMAVAIAEVAATGADLRDVDAQDRIVERWLDWSRSAPDVGVQTAAALSRIDPAAPVPSPLRRMPRQRTCTGAPVVQRGTAR